MREPFTHRLMTPATIRDMSVIKYP